MAALTWPNSFWDQLADEHRTWLSAFDHQYLRNWERLLNNDDEAAMAEAQVRRILQGYEIVVEPNEDLAGNAQRPDFRCLSASEKFYIEVTCIPKEVATEKTGIPDESHGLTPCCPLNDAVFAKCKEKASQCGNLDGPALLVVGTFHTFAAMASFDRPKVDWLLTGEQKMAWDIDMQTGNQIGEDYQVTELYSAAFLRPDKTQGIGFARSSLSGLVLSGLGSKSPSMIGVLHPNPVRPFDPTILPDIYFGQVEIGHHTKKLHVSWPNGDDD